MRVDPAGWALAGTALVAAGYAAAAYQDLRSREVADLTWAPAALGAALMLALGPRAGLVPLALRLGLTAAIGVAAWRFGLAASGDVAALAFLGASEGPLAPVPQVALALAAVLAIWAAEARLRRGVVITAAEAKSDPRWLPRRVLGADGGVLLDLSGAAPEEALAALEGCGGGALVEASYGVPLAAALGIGYIAAAALAALGVAL